MRLKDHKRRVAWCPVCECPVRLNHYERCFGWRFRKWSAARRVAKHAKYAAPGFAPFLIAFVAYLTLLAFAIFKNN